MSTDRGADFRKAAGLPPTDAETPCTDTAHTEAQQKAQQNAQQSPPASGGHAMTPAPLDDRNPLQNNNPGNTCHPVANTVGVDGWAMQDLNLRPPRCQRGALANCANGP